LKYSIIADEYEKIEGTTKRLEMTNVLVGLLKNAPENLIDKIVYLTQGRLYPEFVALEIGVAEKLAIRALSRAFGIKESMIEEDIKKTGDIGETAQNLATKKKQSTFFTQPLTVEKVYQTLDKIAKTSGPGAVDKKTSILAGLLSDASPKEAKYILRMATGNLRLGIADMTVLDALAIAYGGGKESRELIERAYSISSDLGRVAKTVTEKGLEGIKQFQVSVTEPIRSMLAERLSSSEEILEKLGGKCAAEYKYDGERIQAHKIGDHVILFSRRLEDISDQYPDVAKLVKSSLKVNAAVVEGECVAIDLETNEMRPFQELMHRRRKYGIKEAIEEYPISFFMFDLLYADGKDLTQEPYPARHKMLEGIAETNDRIQLAKNIIVSAADKLEKFFLEAIEDGCEGLVCKSIAEDSIYQAGARGWLWIKYKRDYKSEMKDTVDLVTVGAFHGRGKRAGAYGALLLASYYRKSDTFQTVTKCGTGFKDEDLAKLLQILDKIKISHKHPRVQSTLDADVWFEPSLVLEILGAEITLSPIHTCAMNSIRKGSGLAIRFPRFTGNYRIDKAPEDATSSTEIVEMYQNQLKKIDET
jgi:DNA ligase-1